MTDTSTLGFPEAARRLGVSLRVLRHAIRAGKVPAPKHSAATAKLTEAWFDSVLKAVDASPTALIRTSAHKVPPFARYEGTSAWRKYTNRVREYAAFRAAAAGVN
jgi:hypothetical protein